MYACHRALSSRSACRVKRAGHARRSAITALTAATALLAAACSSAPAARQLNASAVGSKSANAVAKYLKISPAPGAAGANPTDGIKVSAENGGKIAKVTVHSSGHPVTGALSQDGETWHSAWTLGTNQSYTVTATGTDNMGHPVTATSTFRTLKPSRTFNAEIFEGYNQTYGVGMPIMLIFDQPIKNKAAVERSLRLTTSKPVVGAWYWDGDEHLDFRPRDYWPANTTVSFDGHLDGVDGGDGIYGTTDLTQTFGIGQSVVAVASTTTHRTQVYIGGRLTYTWPISTGRATKPTPNGTYLTVEKHNPVRMIGGKKGKPGYYNELVNYAVRFTYSGDYYHSAPWSVVDQGYSNVSHGCVNLPPADAKAYYNMAIPGDPVTVINSPKAGNWDDGWTEWFLDWNQYLRGSATHQAVEAGPDGSKFVSPSSLPADSASIPIGTSAPGNYMSS